MNDELKPIDSLENELLNILKSFAYSKVIQVSFKNNNLPYNFIAYSWDGARFTNEKLPEDIAIKKAAEKNFEYFKKMIAKRWGRK